MENKIKIYTDLKQKYLLSRKEINKKYNFVSTLRFSSIAIILCLIFFYFKTDNLNFIWTAIVIFFVFFLLVKWHDKISFKRKIYKTLKIINQEEINYLENNETPFENGIEYLPKNHDYAFDLDILGNKSLFHNLNRTASFIGKKTLAKNLLNIKLNNEILENQESIKELTLKIDFRQKIYSLTRIKKDSEEIYQRLINWTSKKEINSFILKIISFVFPALFLFFFIMTFINENQFYSKIASLLFMVNLMIIGKYFKKIKKEIPGLSKINETIRYYSLIIEIIENEKFTSAKLIGLQKKLEYNSVKASVQINNLSSIVKQIESIHNPIGALFKSLAVASFILTIGITKLLIKNSHFSNLISLSLGLLVRILVMELLNYYMLEVRKIWPGISMPVFYYALILPIFNLIQGGLNALLAHITFVKLKQIGTDI